MQSLVQSCHGLLWPGDLTQKQCHHICNMFLPPWENLKLNLHVCSKRLKATQQVVAHVKAAKTECQLHEFFSRETKEDKGVQLMYYSYCCFDSILSEDIQLSVHLSPAADRLVFEEDESYTQSY